MIEFGASDLETTSDQAIGVDREEHPERRCDEVNPEAVPYAARKRRRECARRVHTHSEKRGLPR